MKKSLLAALAVFAISSSAFAAGSGTVTFTGEIVDAACGISADTLNQAVSLGQVPAHLFKAAGDKSTPQNFTIALTDCDTTVAKQALFTFTGATAASDPTKLLLGTNGSATNVGIRLQSASGEYLNNGAQQSAPVLLGNGTNNVQFAAMYEATAIPVTPGTADGVANFTVAYQ